MAHYIPEWKCQKIFYKSSFFMVETMTNKAGRETKIDGRLLWTDPFLKYSNTSQYEKWLLTVLAIQFYEIGDVKWRPYACVWNYGEFFIPIAHIFRSSFITTSKRTMLGIQKLEILFLINPMQLHTAVTFLDICNNVIG